MTNGTDDRPTEQFADHMKIALLIFIVLVVLAVVAYFLFFPRGADFVILSRPGGGTVTFSRSGISFEAPNHYRKNGFQHIEPYVARLVVPTNKFKFLNFFTPDRNRGFSFSAKDSQMHAHLVVDWRKEPEREAAIRAFFNSRGIAPSRDYLANNGGVPDATRILEYPVTGTPSELTALTCRILQELCGVSPTEALDISYRDK